MSKFCCYGWTVGTSLTGQQIGIKVLHGIEVTEWVSGRFGTRIGVSNLLSCKTELSSIPDLCPGAKTRDEVGSLTKNFGFEFLQTSPLKQNLNLETSFKNSINKLFCRRIIYHKKRSVRRSVGKKLLVTSSEMGSKEAEKPGFCMKL